MNFTYGEDGTMEKEQPDLWQCSLKRSTRLGKLMDTYCRYAGLQASVVRFMARGRVLAPDDTAEQLGLEDEDVVDVHPLRAFQLRSATPSAAMHPFRAKERLLESSQACLKGEG